MNQEALRNQEPVRSQDAPRFSPVIALLAVSAMWEGQLSAILKDLGITTRKFGLLGHIYAEPGISFSELARRSHITVQSAHTAVRTLVDDGLVEDATAHAGAASDLHVTPKGARVLRDARDRLFELDGALAQRLPNVAASLDGIRAGIV
ncbi:MarR family winged helix-turn-helix transcriptional regulator [Microbacterium paulum]